MKTRQSRLLTTHHHNIPECIRRRSNRSITGSRMPLARREVFQLLLLMSVVPLQYLLSSKGFLSYDGSNSQIVKGIVDQYSYYIEKTAASKLWKTVKLLWSFHDVSKNKIKDDGHLVKEELDKEEKFFAGSQEPRYERQSTILYKIGDVLMHKRHGYRAVVVGWDYQIEASDEWKNLFYKDKEELMLEPHYLLAIDTRDRMVPQFGYVAQSSLEPASPGVRVIHPNIEYFFEIFNGEKFVPRPWLQETYPRG